jgi:hypothetical protein
MHRHRTGRNDYLHFCLKCSSVVKSVNHEVVSLAGACNHARNPSQIKHANLRVFVHTNMRYKGIQKSLFFSQMSMNSILWDLLLKLSALP